MEEKKLTRHYEVIARVRKNLGEPSAAKLRARALPGQGIPVHLNIAFSRPTGVREGDLIKIAIVTEMDKEGSPYLRAAASKYQTITIVNQDEARLILIEKNLSEQDIAKVLDHT